MSSTAAITGSRTRSAQAVGRRPVRPADGLSAAQRRTVVGAIAFGHVAALWAVLQVPAVREAVHDAAPMFVELIAPPAPPAPPVPAPPPPPVVKAPPPRVLAAPPAPTPAPAPFEVAPTPVEPVAPAAVAPAVVQAPPAPPAPPPPPPRMIPASAIQYLGDTPIDFPRMSRRLNESGTVTLRVYIDERGLPANVLVAQHSGFPRLDEAAVASVKRWRFKPYTENGQALAGWALIPVIFELEK